MRLLARISAAAAVALALVIGGAGSAIAKHGADDPPGHHKGAHHHHGMHHHKGHHGHGADDGPNHQ
jgi:Spy/CpxP family protein refolding chaperone